MPLTDSSPGRTTASAHLERIGNRARLAGSPAAAEARAYCADVLRRAGFATSERRFEYSAFPGLWATPVAGVVAVVAAIGFYVGRTFPDVLAVTVASLVVVLVG